MAGRISNSRCIRGLRLTRSPTRNRPSNSCRRASTRERSRKVSAPPTTRPSSRRSTAVETLMGIRLPLASMMYPDLPMTGRPVCSVCWRAQSAPHMLERNTSAHRRPMASARATPVISSAARLNDVTCQSRSSEHTVRDALEDGFGRREDGVCSARLAIAHPHTLRAFGVNASSSARGSTRTPCEVLRLAHGRALGPLQPARCRAHPSTSGTTSRARRRGRPGC